MLITTIYVLFNVETNMNCGGNDRVPFLNSKCMQRLFDLLRRVFDSDRPNSTSVHKLQSFISFSLND